MSPTLIKELSHFREERHGSQLMVPVYGNVSLVEFLDEIHVFIDARQPQHIREYLRNLDGKKGIFTDIESVGPEDFGKIQYEPSRSLDFKLFTARDRAVHIYNRKLRWRVHIGRTRYLHRRYYRGNQDNRPDLPKYLIRYP